jgi:hypothetical protein
MAKQFHFWQTSSKKAKVQPWRSALNIFYYRFPPLFMVDFFSHLEREYNVKKVSSFQAIFGLHYQVGQNLTYFLHKKLIFVLFDHRQAGVTYFLTFFYLLASGCSI